MAQGFLEDAVRGVPSIRAVFITAMPDCLLYEAWVRDETDWVIDPAAEKTCEAATVNDKDAWLHDLICDLKGDDVWNITLTPNYNADHRNHFHVDLTAGSDFIRRHAPRAMDDGPNDW